MVNSKQKGNGGEREFAKVCREHGYSEARRGVQYAGSPDSPDVVGIKGFHFEVKRRKKISHMKWVEQAERDSGEDEMPVVAFRQDRSGWCITLSAENFFKLLEKCHE